MTERETLLAGEPSLLRLFRRAAAMITLGHKLGSGPIKGIPKFAAI